MNSAGNDIVALAAIDVARTRQPKFYSRIITPAEQEFYSLHLEDKLAFEHFVWMAWSVKESAYKFLKRSDPDLVFSPSKIKVEKLEYVADYFEGTVRFGDHLLYSKSLITNDFIFSLVNGENDFSELHYEISQIDSKEPEEQSRAVRTLLISKLSQLFPESDLCIVKNAHGCPVVMNGYEELPVPVSFTHHDRFVAYTFPFSSASWKAHAEIL